MTLAPPVPSALDAPAHLYARALLIREVETRLLDLFAQGKLNGTVHTCVGQEWTGIAVAEALRPGDFVFSNHRCHGHYLARTDDVDGLVAEVMGKATGTCGGRGGSQHLCRDGFFSNGVQGGIVPVAAGLAFAQQFRGEGVTAVFVGDGTLGEGVLYEALNIAAKWALPLLIVLEDNGYAQSTAQRQTLAGSVAGRAAAFGIPAVRATTDRPAELLDVVAKAVGRVRDGGGPVLVHAETYRLMAHSKGDDDRDPDEVRGRWDADPTACYVRSKRGVGREAQADARRRVDAAVAAATAAPATTLSNLELTGDALLSWRPLPPAGDDRVVQRIHAALAKALADDPRAVVLGEDVEAPYGGAFKVTKSLSDQFPGRVRNCPISEAAIVGVGNGLALAGMRPVCEIMFGDFMGLAFDQWVNHAAKFRWMYNDQVTVPLVVRTPMGGRRGYGPTHSQSLEKHFLGVPGTQVLALNSRLDPFELYGELFRTLDRPTLVIENKLLYGMRLNAAVPAGFHAELSDEPFPTLRLRPDGPADVTIVCYGGLLTEVEAAAVKLFDEWEIIAEVICPARLEPFDARAVVESARRTGRLVVAEEGQSFAGFGAEVVATVAAVLPRGLRSARRVGPLAVPIPAAASAEREALPGCDAVVAAARRAVADG